MKNRSVAAGAVLLLALWLPAPAAAETEVGLGLKAGPCVSNVRWSLDDGSGETFRRLTIGFLIEVSLGPRFAVQPELDLVTVGYSWLDLISAIPGKHEDALQYLQVPILFKVRLVPKGWIVPAVFAGPTLGVLLKASYRFTELSSGLSYGADIKDLYRDFDLGAAVGAGVNIKVRNLKLLLDVRYYLGLADVYRAANISVKNAGLMFTGGLGF